MTLAIRAVRPDRNRPEPLWRQTELALRSLIADGTWVDGDQLPNEAKWAADWKLKQAPQSTPVIVWPESVGVE